MRFKGQRFVRLIGSVKNSTGARVKALVQSEKNETDGNPSKKSATKSIVQ